MQNAFELNGRSLRQTDKRLLSRNALDLLSWTFSEVMDGRDSKQRKEILAHMHGRIGEHGGIIAENEHLPEDLQGKEMPSWYDEDYDPFSKTITANL